MTFPAEREILPDNRVLQRTDPKEHFVDTDKWCYCQGKSVCRKPGTRARQPLASAEWTQHGIVSPPGGRDQAQNAESEEELTLISSFCTITFLARSGYTFPSCCGGERGTRVRRPPEMRLIPRAGTTSLTRVTSARQRHNEAGCSGWIGQSKRPTREDAHATRTGHSSKSCHCDCRHDVCITCHLAIKHTGEFGPSIEASCLLSSPSCILPSPSRRLSSPARRSACSPECPVMPADGIRICVSQLKRGPGDCTE